MTEAKKSTAAEVVVEDGTAVAPIAPIVPINLPLVHEFVGIISASRTIVEPSIGANGKPKQGLVLLTVRNGMDKVRTSIGTAFLLAIEAFKNGMNGQPAEIEYESCIKDVTTYETPEGVTLFHTFTGNRIVTLEPIDNDAYLSICIAMEKRDNLELLQNTSGDSNALVAYLKG